MRYSEAEKRVVYEPVSLPQDFRTFDFLMPWQGPEYHLPGDEKASGEGPGAPTPVPAPTATPAPDNSSPRATTPKTTDSPAQTGAGAPADRAAKADALKPREEKAAKDSGKSVEPTPVRARSKDGGRK